MTEMILNSRTLPEPLFRIVRSEKVKVREVDGIISLVPVIENKNDCPLRGIASDSSLTVEKFLAMKRADKELE